jgi:acyl-CoA thioesterase-1
LKIIEVSIVNRWIYRFVLGLVLFLNHPQATWSADQEHFVLTSPTEFQVIQRRGWVPQLDFVNRSGGAARGFADITLTFAIPSKPFDRLEARAVPQGQDATQVNWKQLDFAIKQQVANARLRVDAGGWYRIEVRLLHSEQIVFTSLVEHVGIGEVFIVAGQSYATNCNDAHLKVTDEQQRVACFDWTSDAWRIANDPQPVFDGSDGGSMWPVFGDQLAEMLNVPIGIANVAVGGTSSKQWLPEGNLHPRLQLAATKIGHFRGVLWQQGESDVIDKRPAAGYVSNLLTIRQAFYDHLDFQPQWWIAKSTLHPTVYREPLHESNIRRAYEILVADHGFRVGPDTDRLGGKYRGDATSRRHFSEAGQIAAGQLWASTIHESIGENRPEHEAVLKDLDGLNLRQTAWNSDIVYRESSVLIDQENGSAPQVRLAFPAKEILEIRSANGSIIFESKTDYLLSSDGQTIDIKQPKGIESIKVSSLYPAAGAPQSYRHRKGNPDQNLLYAPGHWFHDRNVEVTYRRADLPTNPSAADNANSPINATYGSLPKTLQKLSERKGLRIGVSGDSISTGLDSSATTQTIPNQFGYPELVAAQLQEDFGGDIHLTNRSVAGWSVANGLKDLPELLKSKPDLILIAYGMNDVGRKDPQWFVGQLSEMLTIIRKESPDTEVILISTMLGNSEWVHTPSEMFPAYQQAMNTLVGDGVAMADVTAVWTLMQRKKNFLDMTGNGLNHPNDFGHRLYAQTILSLFPLTVDINK